MANTTIPAVAVEGSMYGAVGTSAEITVLATQFLPPQVANAISHGFNPQVYASEALGLVFAFNNENGSSAIRQQFRPFSRRHAEHGSWRCGVRDSSFDGHFRSVGSTPTLVNAIQELRRELESILHG